ncbi:MAG TPA: response regulator [Gammaproteobacteria bacterium]|nr:response regulator [Gammaproteobacteria bacterium]
MMPITETHILIANTDPGAREQIRQCLEADGFSRVSEAATGLAAVEILGKHRIDILVTDIPLGPLDGWRLARLVRSGVLESPADTPILIVSSTCSERIAEVTAREFEVNRFISFSALQQLPLEIRGILAGNRTPARPTLLAIEDHADTTRLIERILSRRFDIETAADGEAGLEAWRARRHDLVLLDIMLPKLSGEQVLTSIIDSNPHQAVVIMTAHSSAERAAALLLDGAVDFIAKPFRSEQLRRVCEIAVRREDFMVSNAQFSQRLAELHQSEDRYRRLIEAFSENHFFYTCNRDGDYTWLSPSLEHVLGHTHEMFMLHHEEYLTDHPVNQAALRQRRITLSGTQQPPCEMEIRHSTGSIVRLEITEIPIRDNLGQIIALEGIAHDITERIQIQRQLRQAQKMEAIGQLTGGIAHDFNNILGSILGYTGLAQQKFAADGEGKLAEYLSEVYRAGERARDLIAQLLAFSRGGSATPRVMMLAPLVKESVKMMRVTMPSSIALVTEVEDDTAAVLMDAVQLQQLIMNLCINARDAIEGSKGYIAIRLRSAHDIKANCSSCHLPLNGDFVELAAEDNGEGISEDILTRIFDPFFTTKAIGKGTGMGLSMVHGIVHGHGGHILVDSKPGKGTVFRLLFPVHRGAENVSVTPDLADKPVSGSGRIMVVDDDPALTHYLEELLQERGYRVTALTDSREALQHFEQDPHAIDLLLTDQTMPGLAGIRLAQAMLARRPDLPVILCTGYSDKVDAGKAHAMNISGYFTKPVDPVRLTRLMHTLLTQDTGN